MTFSTESKKRLYSSGILLISTNQINGAVEISSPESGRVVVYVQINEESEVIETKVEDSFGDKECNAVIRSTNVWQTQSGTEPSLFSIARKLKQ